jgi:molecular chaperone GrpE
MSDFAPPDVAASAAQHGAEGLSAEAIDSILADFRAWLHETKDVRVPSEGEGAGPELDVATVLQHFIALRQEVNLQTRASRTQQEQSAQTIDMLQEALGTLQRQQRQLEEAEGTSQDELLRPLLKTLIDAHDALTLAEREVKRLLDLSPSPTPAPLDVPPAVNLRLPYWTRWFGLDSAIETQLAGLRDWYLKHAPIADEGRERYRKSLDALLVGYRMSRERIERALEQQGLEPIVCLGPSFDPEIMEVAEVVREPGRSTTEVIQELRRGYLWRDRLFRCAQVRVARG